MITRRPESALAAPERPPLPALGTALSAATPGSAGAAGTGAPAARRPIRRILAVGSPYDAYILQEAGFPALDGRTERDAARPAFYQVPGCQSALERLAEGDIDLVLTDLHLGDGDGFALGRLVHARYPELPVVLLTSRARYGRSGAYVQESRAVDRIFIWHGHADLMSAIVWSVEDERNLDFDLRQSNLRFILVVEDEPTVYSRFLPIIYREVIEMTRDLLPPGLGNEERERRLRERARVLLVESYEDAVGPLERYADNLLGVVSDIQYPRGGQLDPRAGLALVERVKSLDNDIPIIIQSSEEELRPVVEEHGAAFICKHSPHLIETLRSYLDTYFGFGDFVFRDPPSGREIARAGSLAALRQVTAAVPLESFLYHGQRNHFSNWLYVHGAHDLADELRPITGDGEPLRRRMLDVLDRHVRPLAPRVP